MIEAPHLGRLRWSCRRGMLELDLVFERFWTRHGDKLTASQALHLEELLQLEETDLWETIAGRRAPPAPRLRDIIELLREV